MLRFPFFSVILLLLGLSLAAQESLLPPGTVWTDQNGLHVNAHGGNVIHVGDTYYWYGESRSRVGGPMPGVSLYTSKDMLHWHDCGIVLFTVADTACPIQRGCVIERPKVVRCPHTDNYVMLFHLELKGKGYAAAMMGFADSPSPEGPFTFRRALRPTAGKWPMDFKRKDRKLARSHRPENYKDWWTPAWEKAVREGMYVARDLKGGQMSRDQTIFVDDDGKAYQISSSEENLTLHINELTSDYMGFTGRYVRVAPGEMNEAPTLLKHNGTYWLITSGCTGWAPNEARMYSAKSIWGPWTRHPSPCRGPKAKTTFDGQGNYIFRQGQRFIFMADRWQPKKLSESPHIWLPITFDAEGVPVIEWKD